MLLRRAMPTAIRRPMITPDHGGTQPALQTAIPTVSRPQGRAPAESNRSPSHRGNYAPTAVIRFGNRACRAGGRPVSFHPHLAVKLQVPPRIRVPAIAGCFTLRPPHKPGPSCPSAEHSSSTTSKEPSSPNEHRSSLAPRPFISCQCRGQQPSEPFPGSEAPSS